MSAKIYVQKAVRTAAMPSRGLRRFDTCSCHPGAWGKKKGLRRARRRVGRTLVLQGLQEGQAS